MITKSMTGYGKGISERDGQKLTIEIRAVNHRFLDLNFKLPRGFAFGEDVLRGIIKTRLERGHLDVFVNYENNSAGKVEITADSNIAAAYVKVAQELSAQFNLTNNFGVTELMRMADVLNEQTIEQSPEELTVLLQEACVNALAALDVMREKEGGLLQSDMLAKVNDINGYVNEVEKLAPLMQEEHRAKMRERVQQALGDIVLDESKLANELAFYSDKVCVDEEITRLRTHTSHFGEIIAQGGVVGKQLDFIVQEMNREANTIGSKCSSTDITNCLLQLKDTIEKIREQIQNIE
ncbi:MAG: YicC/YloC family endoribonuclease [Clostridia bacterium]